MKTATNGPTMLQPRFLLLAGMIFAAALTRLVPHPPNFAPIGAMALFGGAYLTQRRWAFLIPLTALFVSDLILYSGKYEQYRENWLTTSSLVYGSFALIVCLGFWLRNRRKLHNIAAATLAGSVLFFVVTNFGVWLFSDMYPKTVQGLIACCVAAIPFFHNTLLGDAVYATGLFGGFALAEKQLPVLQEQPALGHVK